ncbi:MAG: SCP2 sterol-binding domain-containing protein [Zoogloea sp.]|uniref:ubiquinone anaerobic biosynthesis accessory factor UbiT n=1 Tax=Zoogloea sp. TaxID=49181 RepID=UPI00260744A1|nr:SCP2 sterol-binding domain-containing protein [Zoogloea sp.]MDD2990483.1 SCP2 sterol-binding domain-containing protein [Zoogloea sp.]
MKIPAFTLPAPLARVGARLPQLPPTLALVAGLNLALDRVLPRDTLEPLAGKRLLLKVTDAGMALRFTLTPRGFRPLLDSGRPDLTISATTRDYLALALREEDPDTLFFSRRLLMEGETDLGLLVKNTLDAVDWDSVSTRLAALKLPFARQLFARAH